ncbi:MAG: HlyD family efflux transporter periplasmic adaptor subunit [Pirellulales bacterium]
MPAAATTADLAPLPLIARSDLVIRRQKLRGRPWWVVKDPLSLNYFRFEDQEFFILRSLDGESSLAEIQEQFEAEYAPERIEVREIMDFAAALTESGLVIANSPGQGQVMHERRAQRRRRKIFGALSNVLAIRFRGFDPDRLLDRCYPYIRWAFTKWAVLAAMILGLCAIGLLAVQFETFYARLPDFHQFFTRENAFWLAVILACTKICHELGHAFACKHFRGECHEIGVLLLVFSPCLYCNVSDSWMLPSKWQRIAIGAAGMCVELVIASVATFVWWYSQPGLLHHLCLSTMFVCSVTTVLFNINPLLRYDGYYMLADYLEIPNLRQKSSEILQRGINSWFLGIEPPYDPFLPGGNRWPFALFTIASEVYRWFVTFSIIWFLYSCLEPYKLKVVGQVLGGAAFFSLLLQPIWRLIKFLRVPRGEGEVKQAQLMRRGGLVLGAAALLLVVPLPHRVRCPLELQPRDAAAVYVTTEGELTDLQVRAGDTVVAGQPLAQLQNLDSELAAAELTRKRDRQQTQLANVRHLRHLDGKVAGQLGELTQSLASLELQLERTQQDIQRLQIVSPRDGQVIPPPAVTHNLAKEELGPWTGTPLERRNTGAYLPAGVLLCHIGDPGSLWADLVIDQSDVEFVRIGQTVKLKLDELPGETFVGTIAEISRRDLRVTPRQLSNKSGGELASRTDDAGQERPMSASYLARVALDDPSGLLCVGGRGRASIQVPLQSLGQWGWRWWQRTFHFKL